MRVTLGEPFWRTAGTREVDVTLEAGRGLSLSELCARLGVPGLEVGAGDAEPPLFVVNGQALSGSETRRVVVRDGDNVTIQLMLSGG